VKKDRFRIAELVDECLINGDSRRSIVEGIERGDIVVGAPKPPREDKSPPHVCGDPSSSCDTSCEENAARGREIMNRPTAADALKAVRYLADAINAQLPINEFAEGLMLLTNDGCTDLIAGRRDTPAARAITGEAPINSSCSTEAK
jgi:hypothetical protein